MTAHLFEVSSPFFPGLAPVLRQSSLAMDEVKRNVRRELHELLVRDVADSQRNVLTLPKARKCLAASDGGW